ncbi:MAG: hypothetical protein HC877_03350 [Thioploca sp.]|nr:hypothetical protein [Thioploca sp.]
MNILGIHDGHTATACLLQEGSLVAMVSEERFNRQKNCAGIPQQAIRWILESTHTTPSQIDAVALSGLVQPWIDPNITIWNDTRRPILPNLIVAVTQFLPPQLWGSNPIVTPYVKLMSKMRKLDTLVKLLDELGIPIRRLTIVEHHLAHISSSYYLSPFTKERTIAEPILAITLDASGDGIGGTVSIAQGNNIKRLLFIPTYHSIGMMYKIVTRYLGMKPMDHEYKVMGLAPYAPEELAKRAYQIFSRYLGLSTDGLRFLNTSGKFDKGFEKQLERDLRGIRFDAVAAGIQLLLEEVVTAFIRNWIKHTGVKKIVLGGGIFMNVKLNMLIQSLPEIESVFFMPSAGDESNAAGAALSTAIKLGEPQIKPLNGLYLGPEFTTTQIEGTLHQYEKQVVWERIPTQFTETKTVELLLQGHIVGRFAGRMEWGARALGNRSILADGRDLSVIRKINAAIKQRDFWMPFAPSLLWERQQDYLVNPRNVDAPYMALGFHSTPLAQVHLKAALHQYDLTCRPQLVRSEINPRYHNLLKEWERLTGCGGLLNTSFNLHGEPIVCSPKDAIETFLRSEIDDLMIEDYWIQRKNN